jgi:hypothetical protein
MVCVQDYNPIYNERHEVQFFGRGSIAGVDLNAQKKSRAKFYEKLMTTRRTEHEKRKHKELLKNVGHFIRNFIAYRNARCAGARQRGKSASW